ncbi:MAG: hypothetical protein HY541_03165 [Deltaproteobacteria bacterium]|nr:hypothetical protein [Deltaproteobacteria bacterium]
MIVVFIVLIVLGLVILYPITPRYFKETKKLWITVGTILIHIGAYGLLWLHLPGVVFVSLLLFEAGLFVVWDPFHLCPPPQKKLVNTIGFIVTAAGVIISLSIFTSFPLWLWALPLIIALLPYVVPPLGRQSRSILALSIILVIVYLGIMGLNTWRRLVPEGEKTVGTGLAGSETKSEKTPAPETPPLPPPSLPGEKTVTPAPTVPLAGEPPGPVTRALQGIDKRMQELEEENARLKMELETLRNENLKLRESMVGKNREIEQQKEQIEGIKGAVEKL